MFTSLAYAQDGAPTAAMGGGLGMFLPLILFFVVIYFMMIRPQQKRQRQLAEAISALKAGDQVITTSGFIATVDSVIDANTFTINLGGGVKVQILRSGIAGKYEPHPSMPEKK